MMRPNAIFINFTTKSTKLTKDSVKFSKFSAPNPSMSSACLRSCTQASGEQRVIRFKIASAAVGP